MKKTYLVIAIFLGIALSYSFIKPDHDASDPGWTWMSGDVIFKEPAKEKAFKIHLGSQFKAGEKLRITFDKYKVTLGGFTPKTTFDKWTVHVNLVSLSGDKWLPLKDENNNDVDKVFSGANNKPSDSLRNYSFVVTLPKNKEIMMTVLPQSFEFDNISGNGHPMFTNGRLMISVAIKGMEIDKLSDK